MDRRRNLSDGTVAGILVGLVVMIAGPYWSIWWAFVGFGIWIAALAGAFETDRE